MKTNNNSYGSKFNKSSIFLLLILITVFISFYTFFLLTGHENLSDDKFVIGQDYVKKIRPEKELSLFKRKDDRYYNVKITYDTEEKNGFLTDKKIYQLLFIKQNFDIRLKMKTISLYDYLERISELKGFITTNNASLWKSYEILEKLDIDKENFVNENFTEFYIYLGKKSHVPMERLKSRIIEILKDCMKNSGGRIIVEFNVTPNRITDPEKITKRYDYLEIE